MKNGFTLIEIISVLLLLGILSVIAISSVINVINNSKDVISDSQMETIKEASLMYSSENNFEYRDDVIRMISFDSLISEGLLDEKDVSNGEGTRLPGCVTYKWENNSNSYNFFYESDCSNY